MVVMNTPGNDQRYGDSRTLLNYGFAEAARRDAQIINVALNGEPLNFDVAPQTINDRIMIPVGVVFEALGVDVQWDGATRSISALTADGKVINFRIGSTALTVDGESIEIDAAPLIVGDRTLVSIRFIEEALGAAVSRDRSIRTILIKSP